VREKQKAFGCTYYFVEEIQDYVWEDFTSQDEADLVII